MRSDNQTLLLNISSGVLDGAFIAVVNDSFLYSESISDDFKRFNLCSELIEKCKCPHLVMSENHPLASYMTISKYDKDELIKYPFIITTANRGHSISTDIKIFNYLYIPRNKLKIRSIDSSNEGLLPYMLKYSDSLYIDVRFSGTARYYGNLISIPIIDMPSSATTYFVYSTNKLNNTSDLNALLDIISKYKN